MTRFSCMGMGSGDCSGMVILMTLDSYSDLVRTKNVRSKKARSTIGVMSMRTEDLRLGLPVPGRLSDDSDCVIAAIVDVG